MEWRALTLQPAAPARFRHSLTAIPGTAKALGFGGKSTWTRDAFCDDAWLLDAQEGTVKPLAFVGDARPSARASHCALWLNGAVFVYGGLGVDGPLSDLWRLHIDYTRLLCTATRVALALPPRFSHSGVVFDGTLLFTGGCDTSHCNTVVQIDAPDSDEHRCGTVAATPELFSRHQAVLVGNRLCVVGGGMTCFSFGSIFAEHVQTFTFGSSFLPPPLPADAVSEVVVAAAAPAATAASRRTPANHSRSPPARRLIARVVDPSPEQFRHWVQQVREPCLFSSCGVPLWTRADILAAVAPETPASIHVCNGPLLDFANKNYQFEVVPFGTMLERMEDPAQHLYFRSLGTNARKDPSSVTETFPKLAEQFFVPPFAAKVY
jgi:hypothetical protein